MNRYLGLFLSFLFVNFAVLAPLGFAQEQSGAEDPSASADVASQIPDDNAANEQAGSENERQSPASKPRESFVPSEEISEDLSVSFPVDI